MWFTWKLILLLGIVTSMRELEFFTRPMVNNIYFQVRSWVCIHAFDPVNWRITQ